MKLIMLLVEKNFTNLHILKIMNFFECTKSDTPTPPIPQKKINETTVSSHFIFQYFDGIILFSNKDLNNIKIPENSNIKIMQYSHQEGISQWFVYCNFLDDFNICLRYSCIQIKCEFIESVIWVGNTINIYQFEFFFFLASTFVLPWAN